MAQEPHGTAENHTTGSQVIWIPDGLTLPHTGRSEGHITGTLDFDSWKMSRLEHVAFKAFQHRGP